LYSPDALFKAAKKVAQNLKFYNDYGYLRKNPAGFKFS
jgi:hypothetical protein